MRKMAVLSLSILVGVCGAANAQTPPKGSTAQCVDGSFSSIGDKSRACAGHKGVKRWLAQEVPAVQTQSPAVTSTGVAPTTGVPTRTPAVPADPGASAPK